MSRGGDEREVNCLSTFASIEAAWYELFPLMASSYLGVNRYGRAPSQSPNSMICGEEEIRLTPSSLVREQEKQVSTRIPQTHRSQPETSSHLLASTTEILGPSMTGSSDRFIRFVSSVSSGSVQENLHMSLKNPPICIPRHIPHKPIQYHCVLFLFAIFQPVPQVFTVYLVFHSSC